MTGDNPHIQFAVHHLRVKTDAEIDEASERRVFAEVIRIEQREDAF